MSHRLALLLGSAVVGALFPTGAFAQCAPTGPDDYLCANLIGSQSITGSTVRVTTAPGLSITGPATTLHITSTGGEATYFDPNRSPLTATGGAGNDAPNVTVDAGGTFLDIDTNGALSGDNGLVTVNNGTGSHGVVARGDVTGVTATGSVTGAAARGIDVSGGSTGTSVAVAAAQVTGATDGIYGHWQHICCRDGRSHSEQRERYRHSRGRLGRGSCDAGN